MKLVTFNRSMRPYGAGDSLVVPDAMAAELEADGAVRDVRPFPPVAVAPVKLDAEPAPAVAPPKHHRVMTPELPAEKMPRHYYHTRKGA
jgi:hypothetical protein